MGMSRPLPDKYESSGGFLSLSAASTQANERKGGETSGAEKAIVRERKNLFILCSGFTVSHDTDSCPPPHCRHKALEVGKGAPMGNNRTGYLFHSRSWTSIRGT